MAYEIRNKVELGEIGDTDLLCPLVEDIGHSRETNVGDNNSVSFTILEERRGRREVLQRKWIRKNLESPIRCPYVSSLRVAGISRDVCQKVVLPSQ